MLRKTGQLIILLTYSVIMIQCTFSESSSDQTSFNEPNQNEWPDLVSGNNWQISSTDQDPFIDSLDTRIPCRETDYGEEYGGVEISTQRCGYLTIEQPSLVAVSIGEDLYVNLWHSTLISSEPSTATLMISLNDQIVWNEEITIPQEANVYEQFIKSPVDAPQGSVIRFHVRNHGANTYTLYQFKVRQS